MKIHSRRVMVLLAAVWCGMALLASCSDDDETVETESPDLVLVLDEMDRQPVAGIKVVIMDIRSNVPVAGPLVSGEDGYIDFGNFPSGADHRLLVFGGEDYGVFAMPDYESWPKRFSGGAGVLTQPGITFATAVDKTAPARVVEVLVRKVEPDTLTRIAGKVVDAVSGDPLDQVFVSLEPHLNGYQGHTLSNDDVTLDDGKFTVSPIPFGRNPITENFFQIEPLRFTRNGYRPVLWKYDVPNGSDDLDISGVKITMTPVDDSDNASISGRLLRDGLPAADIVVGLEVWDPPGRNKGGAGLSGWAAVTDQEGRYTIENLPAGTYRLQPGFPLADGAKFPGQVGDIRRIVEPGQAIDAGDLIVLHEIEPGVPAHGSALSIPPTTLHWTEVPGANYYTVNIDWGTLPKTDTNSIELPESIIISPGLHKWFVEAYNSNDELLGINQIFAIFRLLDAPD